MKEKRKNRNKEVEKGGQEWEGGRELLRAKSV